VTVSFMRFDTKIAILVRADLPVWQKLNVASFLAGGLVGSHPELAGEPYVDGSGCVYGPLVRQPMLVFAADATELARTLARAREAGLRPAIYTKELFSTGHDAPPWPRCRPTRSTSSASRFMASARRSTKL
jgi:hypothetical protein